MEWRILDRSIILGDDGPVTAHKSTQMDFVAFDDLGATCSVPVAGALLGVSRSSAYKAVENGEIPAIRVGRRIVVPTAALRRMLECGSLLHDESEG